MAIYLDYAATSPMPAEVLAAYTEALALVGNPASIHSAGQNSKRMLEEAREQVAASLGCDSVEVTFTGGGTESVNLAIKGLYWSRNVVQAGGAAEAEGAVRLDGAVRPEGAARPRPRILVPAAEHHATIDTVDWLARHEGAIIEWMPVDELGRIDLVALEEALERGAGGADAGAGADGAASGAANDVALLSLLLANNEVGTTQPVAEAAALAARFGVPVHVDAIAAYGYQPIDFHALGVAALSISAHKIGGPVGVGALVIARSATIEPLLHGGNQQRARSGTQNAAGAVAFGVAATLAHTGMDARVAKLAVLRERLTSGIQSAVPSAVLRGDPDPAGRLSGNVHFTFPGCEGDSLLFLLDAAGFSVSTGSACQAGVPEASHVLLAMGLSEPDARGALRFTLGHDTTEADVDALVAALPAAVERASRAGLAERETTMGR